MTEACVVADPEAWKAALSKLPGDDITLDWRWANHVQACYGWKPIRVLWREKNEPVAAIQLLRFPYRLRPRALCSPFVTTGRLARLESVDSNYLMTDLGKIAESLGLSAIDVRDIAPPNHISDEYTFRLNISGLSPETLLKSFDSKLRSQIKKPIKDGYVAEQIFGSDLLFYSHFQRKMHEFGTPVHSRKFIEGLLRELPDLTRQFVVRDPSRHIIGGLLMLISGKRATIPFAVVHEPGQRSAANMLLYWEALASACGEQISEIDFGRSQKDSGTFKFKLQWGSTPLPLVNRRCTTSGVRDIGFGIRGPVAEKITHWWSCMPKFAADSLGPVIRGFIP